MIIAVLYWVLLFDGDASATNVHKHAVAAAIMIADLFITRKPVRFLHFVYSGIVGIVYGFFTLILFFTGANKLVYNFLDWENSPGIAVFMIAMIVFVLIPLSFLISFRMYQLRLFIFNKFYLKIGEEKKSLASSKETKTVSDVSL